MNNGDHSCFLNLLKECVLVQVLPKGMEWNPKYKFESFSPDKNHYILVLDDDDLEGLVEKLKEALDD